MGYIKVPKQYDFKVTMVADNQGDKLGKALMEALEIPEGATIDQLNPFDVIALEACVSAAAQLVAAQTNGAMDEMVEIAVAKTATSVTLTVTALGR